MHEHVDANSPRSTDRLHHVHGQTNARLHADDGPMAMAVRGHGVRIETDDGQSIIDGFSGLGCVSLGYHPAPRPLPRHSFQCQRLCFGRPSLMI